MRVPRLSRWLWVIGSLAVLGLVGLVVWAAGFRDTTTPLAVEQLESTTPSGPVGQASGPRPGDPGIYVYETTGFEEVDALAGARHDYPPTTFLTLREGGCGALARWDALEERWEERDICTDTGIEMRHLTSYHEWFSQGDTQTYDCADGAFLFPADDATVQWSFECATSDHTEAFVLELIGTETLTVGSEQVDTQHVRLTSTLTGDTEGVSRQDLWRLPGTALIVREVTERSSTTGSLIGDVQYVESLELHLQSILPRS